MSEHWSGENLKRLRAAGWTGGDPSESIDLAVQMVNVVLPGWFWRVATCCVSDDAFVGPDYNDPVHRERLLRDFPQIDGVEWTDITDIDLRPPGRPGYALVLSVMAAFDEIERRKAARGEP